MFPIFIFVFIVKALSVAISQAANEEITASSGL